MQRTRGFLLGAAILLALPAHAQMASAPGAVTPPAGQRAAMTWTGVGELGYECKAKEGGTHEWTFVGPDARLTEAGKAVGKYYAGPTWEAADGSKITGKQVAVAPSSAGNIPLQLVKAEGGDGAFKDVTYIQRLNTKGGVAPAESCSASTAGARKTVPYSADYVFFKAG
jgi:hypothetical protein